MTQRLEAVVTLPSLIIIVSSDFRSDFIVNSDFRSSSCDTTMKRIYDDYLNSILCSVPRVICCLLRRDISYIFPFGFSKKYGHGPSNVTDIL